MSRVFISRTIHPDSFFYKKLHAAGLEIIGNSLLEFSPTSFEQLPQADWIFFYSKNGVHFFFENIHEKNIPLPDSVQLGGFGPATAGAIKAISGICHFEGTGRAETTVPRFLELVKGKTILFPRAENSRQSIQQLIQQDAKTIDLVVYKNLPKKDIPLLDADYLIFTSPMNGQTYFAHHSKSDQQKVFAIGKTTAQALYDLEIKDVYVAAKPTEKELVKTILQNL